MVGLLVLCKLHPADILKSPARLPFVNLVMCPPDEGRGSQGTEPCPASPHASCVHGLGREVLWVQLTMVSTPCRQNEVSRVSSCLVMFKATYSPLFPLNACSSSQGGRVISKALLSKSGYFHISQKSSTRYKVYGCDAREDHER